MSSLVPAWLEVFLAVAEHGSFSKAAESLPLSQPAVTQRIRRLEASLGVSLFHRSPKGATLTPAGRTLLQYAQTVHRLLVAAENDLAHSSVRIARRLKLGATPTVAVRRLPAWLSAFSRRHPHTLVHVHTDTTPRVVDQVARHALHLGLIEGELPGEHHVSYVILSEIPFVIVAPAGEPWTRSSSMPLQALDGRPFVARSVGAQTRRWMDRLFARYGIRPHIVAELDTPQAIKEAVAQGMGLALLPKCMIDQEDSSSLHFLEIEGGPIKRYLKAIWPQDGPMDPLAVAFLESLQGTYPVLRRVVEHARQSHQESSAPR